MHFVNSRAPSPESFACALLAQVQWMYIMTAKMPSTPDHQPGVPRLGHFNTYADMPVM